MKVLTARLYQEIQIGHKLDRHFDTVLRDSHKGLSMDWNQGLLSIRCEALPRPIRVPSANVMYMVFEDELDLSPVKGKK